MKKRVVIVGAGFAGLSTAKGLRRAPMEISLIDRSNHHLFQPLLYQVATAVLSPADISSPIRSVLRGQENVEVTMAAMTGIDVKGRQVQLTSGELEYDYLVLAVGSQYNYFGHDEWRAFAPSLKTIEDARSIRERLLSAFERAEIERDSKTRKSLMTFVLVGGGPTGVEMAGAIAELARNTLRGDFRRINPADSRIILVEQGARILQAFPEKLSTPAAEALARLGVEVKCGGRVENITEEGAVISGVLVPSKNVIWTAGVHVPQLGDWISAETDRAGRVKVTPHLTVPGHPEIFVIGDAACVVDGDNALPSLAPVAIQQGQYVANLLIHGGGVNTVSPFRYQDKGSLATIGRAFAIAKFSSFSTYGFFAWILWGIVHIYQLIGFRNRVSVFLGWLWAYLTTQRGARLIAKTIQGRDR